MSDSNARFKLALDKMDQNTRIAILYLHDLIGDKHGEVLKALDRVAAQNRAAFDPSKIEAQVQSLQQQIANIRETYDDLKDIKEDYPRFRANSYKMFRQLQPIFLCFADILEKSQAQGVGRYPDKATRDVITRMREPLPIELDEP